MRLYACNLFECSRCFDSLNCLFWQDRFSVRFGFLGNATAVYRTVYEAISKAVTNVSVIFWQCLFKFCVAFGLDSSLL